MDQQYKVLQSLTKDLNKIIGHVQHLAKLSPQKFNHIIPSLHLYNLQITSIISLIKDLNQFQLSNPIHSFSLTLIQDSIKLKQLILQLIQSQLQSQLILHHWDLDLLLGSQSIQRALKVAGLIVRTYPPIRINSDPQIKIGRDAHDRGDCCPICLDVFNQSSMIISLPCHPNHLLHLGCLKVCTSDLHL